ncbi:ATP-binding cassette (ABC) Superfamily [Phytophthora palmivora]|uniref:ATP-binding cassette (ABC) Superfamily n=1 Tax=Phytophthora palmivora TaxID=4796 RepID=A0A2P4YT37_9STRA|nr:ATP-binding cassette (ABC) Superfamily [Phytophthora palmivora]
MFLKKLSARHGLNHGRTSRGAYERTLVQDEPLFVNDIEAARCVLLVPHRIPLEKFTSLRKKSEARGGLFPVWGYLWVQPENTTTRSQAECLLWRWASLNKSTFQELKELREDRLPSYVLDQRDLSIDLSPALKMSAGTVPQIQDRTPKAAKKPRTTYAPAVCFWSQISTAFRQSTRSRSSGSHEFCDEGYHRHFTSSWRFPERRRSWTTAPHGSGARRPDQGGQEEFSHALTSSFWTLNFSQDSVESLLSDEPLDLDLVARLSLRLAIRGLEVLRQDLDALGRETHELHGRVDRRVPASAVKHFRRGLDVLIHEAWPDALF